MRLPDSRVILAEAPVRPRRQFPRAGDREEVSKVVPIEVFAGHPLTSPWVAVNGETKEAIAVGCVDAATDRHPSARVNRYSAWSESLWALPRQQTC